MLRIRELDALRGLAAVSVMLFHLTYRYDREHLSPVALTWGHYGVELFFVISGFVILMTAERAGTLADFVVSRVARLFPVFWPVVLLTVGAVALLEGQRPWPGQVAANLTMLPAYLGIEFVDNSYWTLEIELAFYVAVGLLIATRQLARIEFWAFLWLVFAAGAKIANIHFGEPWESASAVYYGQFFIVGITLYKFRNGTARGSTWILLIAATGLSLLGSSGYSGAPPPLLYFGVTLGIVLLAWAAVSHRLSVLLLPPVLWFGDISYPLYLIHQRIGADLVVAFHRHGWAGWICVAAAIAAVIALASALHVIFEVPGRRLVRGIFARPWRSPFASWATPTSEVLAGEMPEMEKAPAQAAPEQEPSVVYQSAAKQ